MNSLAPGQLQDDIAAFSAPPPEVAAAAKKEREAAEKKAGAAAKQLKPAQIEAANRLADKMNEESEAKEKARLIQQLQDYIKLIKEYHPERLEFLKVPKTISAKLTLEELRIAIHDVQTELGKKGGLEFAKVLFVEGFKIFEKANESGWLGLNVKNLGVVAEQSLMPRRLSNGEIIPGPSIPTLAEFCVKHHTWFSTDVDVRMLLMVVELVSTTHRINTQADSMNHAAARPVSSDTKAEMDKL